MYQVIRAFSGYGVGEQIEIGNRTRAAQLQRQGYVVAADHPSLAANSSAGLSASMVQPAPVNAGLLYRLAQMSVSELSEAVTAVEDSQILRVISENDGRAGARLAADGRLATLPTSPTPGASG